LAAIGAKAAIIRHGQAPGKPAAGCDFGDRSSASFKPCLVEFLSLYDSGEYRVAFDAGLQYAWRPK
jgi:hypothetical protein